MTEKIREFLQQKRWLQLKKTDWIAVALVGVLLLVVAMPSGGYGKYLAESKKEGTAQEKTEQKYEKEDYAEYLVSKEILPEIEGVLVVAEGGDSPRIVSDISDAVKALFQVEAHRIKVVKMSSKEDGT